MEIIEEMINVNLTEENKTIARNISEWIKQKRKNMIIDQELKKLFLVNQFLFHY